MKLIATNSYYDETGKVTEVHQLFAEFDGEYEIPGAEGNASTAVAGRSIEIGAVAREMCRALREDME